MRRYFFLSCWGITLASLFAASHVPGWAQVYEFTTFAGRASIGGGDGTGGDARFYAPQGVAVDDSGNVFVADTRNHTIRKIAPGGGVTTVAGTAGLAGSADGNGSAARFNFPSGLALDGSGNVFVADTRNHAIRKITADGVVTTLAGAAGSMGGADGLGDMARFSGPKGVAVDASGNIFVADSGNSTIRKISANGVVTTVAGTAGRSGNNDGTGVTALFGNPFGVAVDNAGNLFVADSLNSSSSRFVQFAFAIRKITPAGVVTTLVKGSNFGLGQNGPAGAASIGEPRGILADYAGNVIFADANDNAIRRLAPDGSIATLAGFTAYSGPGGGAYADSVGRNARFASPSGVASDRDGNLFVADTDNNAIRKIAAGGIVTTVAGAASSLGAGADGTDGTARFNTPEGIAVDSSGNVFVADVWNCTIRRISAGGVVTTLAGAWGAPGSADDRGSAAQFAYPGGVTVDGFGNVYVADSGNRTIRKITADGMVTTIAGKVGVFDTIDGTGSAAGFSFPEEIAVDRSGNLFITDSRSNTIREITPSGVVTTLAGAPNAEGSADGIGGAARFFGPKGIVIDPAGNLIVADSYNHTIRKITAAGVVTTLAGSAGNSGTTDGSASAARFHNPIGVALDSAGNILVGDAGNNSIRQISPAGVVTTVAGNAAGRSGRIDGVGGAARFSLPWGVAVDGSGNILVGDYGNNAVRRIAPGGAVTTLAGGVPGPGSADGVGSSARFYSPNSLAVDGSGNVFVADTYNQTIRKIALSGAVSTLAGLPGQSGFVDAKGMDARFNFPTGVAADDAGNVFVADSDNGAIRKIGADGTVTTLAGWTPGAPDGPNSYADGTGTAARFGDPFALARDAGGNIFVADRNNNAIRKITPAGVVTTLPLHDAAGNVLHFSSQGLAVDGNGNVLVVGGNGISRISPEGLVTTLAGATTAIGFRDGPAGSAWFNSPTGIAVDRSGNVFVAEWGNEAIRMITPDGFVSTIGGFGYNSVDGVGSADGLGSAARFNRPLAVATDQKGNVFVADAGNNTIRQGVPFANPARLGNVSVLASLSGGGDTVTVGAIIGGAGTSGPKPLLVRAAGPSLAPFGVVGFLADPELEFYAGTTRTGGNDDWQGGASLSATFAQVGAFPFAAPSSKDAALYLPSVSAANNTVRVSGAGAAGGLVLTELYDATSETTLTPKTPRLTNVSVLKEIGAGLIAGFIIKGEGTRTVLIRAVGPSLAPFGVTGVLSDPKVEVFDGQQRSLARNDNWSDAGANAAAELNAAFSQVGAFALAGSGAKDAALLVTVTAGNYTVQVRSADGTNGIVLVEVYEVP